MATADQTPISPVTEDNKPELTVSPASVEAANAEPVELDSTPTSPEQIEQQQQMLRRRRGSQADTLARLGPEEREAREKLIAERKDDPAVLVNVPQTPGAEEFGKSEDAEANVSQRAT